MNSVQETIEKNTEIYTSLTMQNLVKKIVKTCIEKDAHKKSEIMPYNGGAYGTEICTPPSVPF